MEHRLKGSVFDQCLKAVTGSKRSSNQTGLKARQTQSGTNSSGRVSSNRPGRKHVNGAGKQERPPSDHRGAELGTTSLFH